MNIVRALFSRYLAAGRRPSPMPVDQNGRPAIAISDAQLLEARDALIRREHSGAQRADKAAAIRANWPAERLASEHAEAWTNGKVLLLESRTGFSVWRIPGSREIELPHDADDPSLGAAVIEVLSYSRELTVRDWEADQQNTLDVRMQHYRDWRDSLMRRHGYKTQRALFANMLHVVIWRGHGLLKFSPSNRVKIAAWEGLPTESEVVVASDSAAPATGAALRLAFSRCLDTVGPKPTRT